MATHKSAIKRQRQSLKRRERNRAAKSALKTAVKKVLAAIEEKDREKAEALFRRTVALINKTASKGIIHKNTASRKISRLARRMNTLLSSPS